MNYQYILFDLDGTLTNPHSGITRSVAYALEKMQVPALDEVTLTSFIGPPLLESFQVICGFYEKQAHQAVAYYRERFSVTGLYENEVFPGIVELLESLKEQERTLALATSKPTVFAERILDHFDLAKYFDVIVGSNLDGTRTDKHEVIQEVLVQLGSPTKEAVVMIGDRKHDIIGAQKEGIASIGVQYGFGSMEELKAEKPNVIVQTVQELHNLFK